MHAAVERDRGDALVEVAACAGGRGRSRRGRERDDEDETPASASAVSLPVSYQASTRRSPAPAYRSAGDLAVLILAPCDRGSCRVHAVRDRA